MTAKVFSDLPDAHQIRIELSEKQREVRMLKDLLKVVEQASEDRDNQNGGEGRNDA